MLKDYKGRRDFERSPEPSADQESADEGPLTFVVQKHAARQLHYDYRLEVDGALKSWAVSKGPSYDPGTKRLAVMVEDHPLDYSSFEGTIPRGQYGAGQVIVWDRGTYSPDENGELFFGDRARAEERMREGLASGKISIYLRGKKLKGSWTLVRMQRSHKNWLLIKHRDEHTDPHRDILSQEASVISGLTIDDLKSGHLPFGREPVTTSPADATGAAKAAFPAKLSPMLASPAATPFSDEQWLFEPKLDGFRTLALINNGKVRLQSRRGLDVTGRYPALAESLKSQPVAQLVLDGEIIALDSKGRLCFQCLQGYLEAINRIKTERAEPLSAIIYYVFDILYLDGYDLMGVPLKQRKELLNAVVNPKEDVRLVEHFTADGHAVYRAAIENGFEGVVAKRQDSLYEPGKRSGSWLKIKAVTSEEFVIGGFTRGTGKRANTFGSLLLGYYDDENNLQHGDNVGSGFDNDTLLKLKKQLEAISIEKSPFFREPEQTAGVTWVKPELVVEVKFAEWTQDGCLRAPVFLRVRDDKPAASIRPARVVEKVGQSRQAASNDRPDALSNVLEQLASPKSSFVIDVAGQKVSLSNLDKVLWPETGQGRALTKRDLITYLARVSPWLLPHLRDRPLTLSRYPDGIYGQHFFQKHYQPVPGFVATVPLSSHDTPGQGYLLCNNLATLLWLGQIADIELHTWFSRVRPGLDFGADTGAAGEADYYASYPDFIVFDVDPYIFSGREPAGAEPELNREAFSKTCQVALELKETLDTLLFPSFVKTSGRTGLHIFVPIQRRLDFHATRTAAETLSRFLWRQHPAEVSVDWAVEKRTGKVFLDYNQNARGKTIASIYSPRPSPEASVSVPLRWGELDKVYPSDFTILNVPKRLVETGDLWANILEAKIDLASLLSGIKPDK
ncbi:MAG: DNA ligase D [Dehalococcoidales bacterium]|nr:DNA ligase D [Dehalococcoidales bacterium]